MAKDTIEMVIKVTDKASKGLKGIRGHTAALSDDLLDVSSSSSEAAGGFDMMAFASTPAAAGILAIATATVGAAAGMFKLAQGASAWADQIAFAANETTLSTDTIIALESAAGAAGIEFGQTREALKGLSARMKEANINGGAASEKFERLGIALKDAAGESRSADDVFRDSIDAIRLIPNATDRAAASMDIFGESGSRLLPIIEGGTAALDKYGEAAAAAGKVLDEDAIKSSKAFDEAMQDFTNAADGAAISLGQDLLPAVTALVRAGAGMVSWLAETGRWLADVNPGFQLLLKLIEKATAASRDVNDGMGFSADDDRLDALALAGFVGEDGLTDKQREDARSKKRADFKSQAQSDIKSSGKRKPKGQQEDPFAGVNAFNALVDELFGAQVLADAQATMDAQGLAADNLALFNSVIMEGRDAQTEATWAANELAAAALDAADATAEKADADRKAARQAAFGVEGGGLQSTLEGGVVSIISALGPQGAIVGNLMSLGLALPDIIGNLIEEIPQIIERLLVDLPQALADSLPELLEVVRNVPLMIIEALPELINSLLVDLPAALAETLPQAMSTMLVDMPAAIIAAAPEIAKSLIVDLPMALVEAFRIMLTDLFKIFAPNEAKKAERSEARRNKQTDRLADKFGETEGFRDRGGIAKLLGGLFANEPEQSFASGGFVSKTGLAMVHRGEEITPQNGSRSSGQQRRMGGGGGSSTTVNVTLTGFMDANSIDKFVQQLNRSIGSRGFGIASVS